MTSPLHNTALELVKTRIKGMRKGLADTPSYLHSMRVEAVLRECGLDDTTCLAGLLHDIIEDSDTIESELTEIGFSSEVIELIKLCSHDKNIANRDLRWMLMIVGLVEAKNPSAWAIKVADVFDNFKESHAMKKERAEFMLQVKIPVILSASKTLLHGSQIWEKLAELYYLVTETVKNIGDELDFIAHELDSTLKLPQEIADEVNICCDEVRANNYTIQSVKLVQAIHKLQKTSEDFNEKNKNQTDVGNMYILVNEASGNMLSCLRRAKSSAEDKKKLDSIAQAFVDSLNKSVSEEQSLEN